MPEKIVFIIIHTHMPEHNDSITRLTEKMEVLLKKQEAFSKEVSELREEIYRLKSLELNLSEELKQKSDLNVIEEAVIYNHEARVSVNNNPGEQQKPAEPLRSTPEKTGKLPHVKRDIEKFIGENLINKIGIAITVIGVAIGAKYAIDHQLISPLMRIISGYLFGSGLLVVALRLKKEYQSFSAVLLSGSMAIIYFLTYSAYSFYSLFPQLFAFILMIIITVFTVTAAIKYNMQVIALIGLVGAYSVPFLLSEGSGNILILFSYTAIINIGILVIAFRKYWKLLYYSSFLITWLMYSFWFWSRYRMEEYFAPASVFLSVFFVTFYAMFLSYKLLQKEKFNIYDIVLLLANSFIFYGIGYNILGRFTNGGHYLGLFTLGNAFIHLVVSIVIYRQKLADRNLFYFVSGLVFIFITISIPVQLNGNWVTLLWAGEATLLFWIGRTKHVVLYETLSYALMYLAFFSLLQDWSRQNRDLHDIMAETGVVPLFNIEFLTSSIFIASFIYINILNHNTRYSSTIVRQPDLQNVISFSISAVLIISLYYTFYREISIYFDQLYSSSMKEITTEGGKTSLRVRDTNIKYFKDIWLINYSLLFVSCMSLVNIKKIRSRKMGYINLVLTALVLIIFLGRGLFILGELKDSYIGNKLPEYYKSGLANIGIRYISFVFAGLILALNQMYVRQDFMQPVNDRIKNAVDLLLYVCLVWILSSELITWLDITKISESHKLALSVFWGICAALIVGIGIWKNKKHLRIAAIFLFALTLIKLFLYDISHLDTISKTIVFVALGLLLLITSFLYNKYRNKISGERAN